eukprot:TRINITY_DN22408_c0_g1_i1.p1 TRINITY_DN22408_c0_g1~~TRINITY_DN22408_c0_g1_i1.p1  ORF type:complete len:536 (-),score=83.52 TRINITY_DN22408_c0_g1_i1:514-2121(-)
MMETHESYSDVEEDEEDATYYDAQCALNNGATANGCPPTPGVHSPCPSKDFKPPETANAPLQINTRPEIRKGCIWDIHLKVSPEIVQKEKLDSIYIERPRGVAGRTSSYLCLKVRSKLIKPVRELPFTKVAVVVNEGNTLDLSDNTLTLRVRFTARPRAVFHKHSDMMILVASIKRGDSVLCTDEKELIFRGGTGSIHSADNRQPPRRAKTKSDPQEDTDWVMAVKPVPVLPTPVEEAAWPSEKAFQEYEDVETTAKALACEDVISKTETAPPCPMQNVSPLHYDETFSALELNGLLTADYEPFGSVETGQFSSDAPYLPPSCAFPVPSMGSYMSPQLPYAVVYGKRRAYCRQCSDCMVYRGEGGGPCLECGCFPSQHMDLDADNFQVPSRKRGREEEGSTPKYLLETKYYQKMFFNCLHFMTLEEISTISLKAPIPLFVKDENSVYIFLNNTFSAFIIDIAQTEKVLYKSTQQVLGQLDSQIVLQQERTLLSQPPGTIKVFDVTIKRQTFQVMKQWNSLRDGKKVILGMVISAV